MQNKKIRNNIYKKILSSIGILFFTTTISPIFISSDIYERSNILNKLENSNKKEEQLYESKRETMFPVHTIQKTGLDSERIVIFFVGEGYTKNDESKFINDVLRKTKAIFNVEPYKSFSNDFNIYAVMPPAEKSGDFSKNGLSNNYLGVYKSNGERTPSIGNPGKLFNLKEELTNNFLDKGGKILDAFVLCNSNEYFGASIGDITLVSLSDWYSDDFLIVHEGGHTFAGLLDEYDLDYISTQEGTNRTKESDPNKVRWKEFFNFRNIGMIKPTYNAAFNNSYIPTFNCKMNRGAKDFCEVCKHHIFSIFNKLTSNKRDLYIANPFISLEHDWKKNEYYLELGTTSFPLTSAQNKKIDFRTVIENLSNKKRKIQLKLDLFDENKKIKKSWTENFEINPSELKNIFILTENIDFEIKDKYTIFGQVIDLETNKELSNSNTDKDIFYDLNINYKLSENKKLNEKISIAHSSSIKVRKGDSIKLFIPHLSGYQFIKKDENLDEILNIQNSKTITFYYKKIFSKEFKLNLLDDDNILETKKQVIYENEIFNPRETDFIFDTDEKIKKILPPNENITYETADNKVINYRYEVDALPYIIANDISIGLNSNFIPKNYAKGFSHDDIEYSNLVNVESNNVDTTKSGHYKVTYSMSYDEDYIYNYAYIGGTTYKTINVIVLNADGTIPNKDNITNPPENISKMLENETNRINGITFSFKNEINSKKQISLINEKILLSNLNNWSKMSGFSYSISNFLKNDSTISFKILVEKDGFRKESKQFNLKYSISDNIISPESELDKEINRINNLDLFLSKAEYTQQEINEINENTLWNNLRGLTKIEGFSYSIVSFVKTNNNSINFKIQVQKNSNLKDSKEFSLSYTMVDIGLIQNELKLEINRINSLKLLLRKTEYFENEIYENNLLNELINLDMNNGFKYVVINFSNKNSVIKFNIQVSKNSITETSNEFSLSYKLKGNNTKNNNLNSLKKSEIILISILIPLIAIVFAISLWLFIYKNKK